ncbi:MAG: hypothetical protein AVDCRST_MAG85-2077, partial [uncultured Solirubrobacteraceae bacterium]
VPQPHPQQPEGAPRRRDRPGHRAPRTAAPAGPL